MGCHDQDRCLFVFLRFFRVSFRSPVAGMYALRCIGPFFFAFPLRETHSISIKTEVCLACQAEALLQC